MTQKKSSISVVMPALNEEENILLAIESARAVVDQYFEDWEILVFNDGSTDKTGDLAEAEAQKDPRIKVTHHRSPINLGGVFKSGIQKASKEFLMMIPGDNENGSETLGDIFSLAGQADLIVPYVVNTEVRPLKRRIISKTFVFLTNLMTGNKLRYYNGTVLHRSALLKEIDIQTNSFGYSAEIISKLILAGKTFKEVGIELAVRPEGESKALKPSNIVQVGKFLLGLSKLKKNEKKQLSHGRQLA